MKNESQKGSRKNKTRLEIFWKYSDLFFERLLIFQHFWILLRKKEGKQTRDMDFKLIVLLAILFISTAQVWKKTNDKIKSLTLGGRGASIEASSAIQQ